MRPGNWQPAPLRARGRAAAPPWQDRHFSADEMGLLELSAAVFALQVAASAYALRVRALLVAADRFHITVQARCAAPRAAARLQTRAA